MSRDVLRKSSKRNLFAKSILRNKNFIVLISNSKRRETFFRSKKKTNLFEMRINLLKKFNFLKRIY